MATDGPAHLLSLKVMRVSRPEIASAWQPFYSSSPSFSAHSSASLLSLQGNNPLPGHPKTLRDLTHTTELLTLPSSFGSIQLGETFSGCLCVNNETHSEVEVAQFKVEMQTASTKVMLYETEGVTRLSGGDTLEKVIHHEIKELGQHVLACVVTYRLPSNFRPVPGSAEDPNDPNLLTFRKFYKFAVTNPLSVKTKVHAPKSPSAMLSAVEREKIFLEVHIQNLTQDAIHFERMRLECTDAWDAIDINMVPKADGEKVSLFSGPMAIMQPQDMRQYIYILTSRHSENSPTNHAPGSTIPLGRLDISWRSSFGEPGRLLTSMLSRRLPSPPAPPPQPASALPPYLKRTLAASAPPRPQSPQFSQSRPGTPPAGQRPSSPAMNRPTSTNAILPHAPLPTHLPSPLPELQVQLTIYSMPREIVRLAQPFSLSLGVTLSTNVPSGSEHFRRRVALVVQHLRLRNTSSPVMVNSQPAEAFSPRLPSSGFSTPSSTPVTFNYALAHQKILAASSRPTMPMLLHQEPERGAPDAVVLPPPYFEGELDELKLKRTDGVNFVGPSTIPLPPVELSVSRSPEYNQESNEQRVTRAQAIQEFELSYVAMQEGFHTVGGLRVLLVEDGLLDETGEENRYTKLRRAHVLKEIDVLGELWVSV